MEYQGFGAKSRAEEARRSPPCLMFFFRMTSAEVEALPNLTRAS
jgi:hypothetical protein